ncbi:hypothetical protein [Alicyclobacillus shizuokensis]|nr:hypothetical protein [Alicyclobacillus shizuokensis]
MVPLRCMGQAVVQDLLVDLGKTEIQELELEAELVVPFPLLEDKAEKVVK